MYERTAWCLKCVRKAGARVLLSNVKLLFAKSADCWSKHNAPRMGAALAFYTLLSLMPLLLVLISVAGLIFGTRAAEVRVMEQVQFFVGYQRAQILQSLLEGAQNKTQGLLATVVGTIVLVFGATGVMVELRDDMNTIWEVPFRRMSTLQELRGMVKGRLWSLALVIAIVIVLTGSLLITASISALAPVIALPANQAVLHLLNAGFSFVATTVVFAAIYKVVPQARVKWREVVLGAAVTAVLFALGNFLLGLYIGKVSFSSTYGAASSTVALTVWVYYSSQIFFLGAEFTKAFAETFVRHARV